jgi:hypothetical protein
MGRYGGNRGGNSRRSNSGNSDWIQLGRISLWEDERGGGKKPVLVGSIELEDGRKVRVSLWENDSDHQDAPELVGTLTKQADGGNSGGGRQQRENRRDERQYDAPPAEDFDDDIPF